MTDGVMLTKCDRTPKSNAQKQRELKQRRKHTHTELKTSIRNDVKADLVFLSELYKMTQTAVLEELITEARRNCGFNDVK
ncbi:TPA: hypothetical protein N6M57_004255 [Escherichia coli]|nr:hypothetical protein [Escherichia coli]